MEKKSDTPYNFLLESDKELLQTAMCVDVTHHDFSGSSSHGTAFNFHLFFCDVSTRSDCKNETELNFFFGVGLELTTFGMFNYIEKLNYSDPLQTRL